MDPRPEGGPLPHPKERRKPGSCRVRTGVCSPTCTGLKVPSPTLPLPLRGLGPRIPLRTLRPPPLPDAQAGQQLLRCHGGVTQQTDLTERGPGCWNLQVSSGRSLPTTHSPASRAH